MSELANRRERISNLSYLYKEQPKDWLETCNLCGGTYFVQITHEDRYDFEASASVCANCGLVFLNPRMTTEAYSEFYTHTYRPLVSAYHGRTINSETIQVEQAEYAEERADFVKPCLQGKPSRRLLDIGGSTGIVSKIFAQQFGVDATVLDPSPDELREAEKLGLATIEGFIEDAKIKEAEFDVVLLCQTIDHLLDINQTLNKIKASLKIGGYFFVDIVDFRAAYLRHGRVEEAIKIDHPYYLTEESVEAYLAKTGFKIVRKGYAKDYLHINYLCIATEEKGNFHPEPPDTLLREIRSIQNSGAARAKK